jgi:hypothetical protein
MFGGEILFRNMILHTTGLLKRQGSQKNLKKTREIFEGRTKDQIGKKVEFP